MTSAPARAGRGSDGPPSKVARSLLGKGGPGAWNGMREHCLDPSSPHFELVAWNSRARSQVGVCGSIELQGFMCDTVFLFRTFDVQLACVGCSSCPAAVMRTRGWLVRIHTTHAHEHRSNVLFVPGEDLEASAESKRMDALTLCMRGTD